MSQRFRNTVGPQIRRLRVKQGWSQDQLAARLQFAGLESAERVFVAKIESRIRSVFDYEVAIIADVLGVKAGDLLLDPTGGLEKLKTELDDLRRGQREVG